MQMLKHRAKGSDVTAVKATADNMADIAAETDGDLFTSPRDGKEYVVLDTDAGSARCDEGTYLVRHEDGDAAEDVWYEVLTADVFDLRYERP